jgi:hypothetical protein
MSGAILIVLLGLAAISTQLATGQTLIRLGGEWQTREHNPYLFWWCISVELAVLAFTVFDTWNELNA